MTNEAIFKFMTENECTVVHYKEDEKWEIRVHVLDKIIGASSSTLDKAVQAAIDFIAEIPSVNDKAKTKTKAKAA